MNGFELNKIFASLLIALLVGMIGSLIGHGLISPHFLEKTILTIDVPTDQGATGSTEKPLDPVTPMLASANIDNGKSIFQKRCTQCHVAEKGGANKIGPNLWSVIGAKVAHLADYTYSKAFKEKGGEWNFEDLNKYLYNPQKHIKGTKMSFPGLQKPQERADVIAYIRTQSDQPVAIQ